MGELRRHERRAIEMKAIVRGVGRDGHVFARDARIVNLSRGGAYLIAHGEIPADHDVEVFLWFGDPDSPSATPRVEPTPSHVVRVEPLMVADGATGGVLPRHGVAVSFVTELATV